MLRLPPPEDEPLLGREQGFTDPRGWRLGDVLAHTPPGWHALARAGYELVTAHGRLVRQAREKFAVLQIIDALPKTATGKIQRFKLRA